MPNLPQPNTSGIPNYATPFLNPDGKTVSEPWYRFLRRAGENATAAVELIQGVLADRPSAAEFHDGSVLFIDTDTSLMYYVQGSAWVQLMNFIGYNGSTHLVSLAHGLSVGDDLAVGGDASVTGDVSAATATISGALTADSAAITTTLTAGDVTASGAVLGDTIAATTTVTAGTDVNASNDVTAGGDVVATGTIAAASGFLGASISVTGSMAAGTTVSAGTTVTATTGLVSLASTITATFFQSGASAGQSNTRVLAKITGGGANGSIVFTGGIETGGSDPS